MHIVCMHLHIKFIKSECGFYTLFFSLSLSFFFFMILCGTRKTNESVYLSLILLHMQMAWISASRTFAKLAKSSTMHRASTTCTSTRPDEVRARERKTGRDIAQTEKQTAKSKKKQKKQRQRTNETIMCNKLKCFCFGVHCLSTPFAVSQRKKSLNWIFQYIISHFICGHWYILPRKDHFVKRHKLWRNRKKKKQHANFVHRKLMRNQGKIKTKN